MVVMVHSLLSELASDLNIDDNIIMNIIENSIDFNSFYIKIKTLYPEVSANVCLDAWTAHWETYSRS